AAAGGAYYLLAVYLPQQKRVPARAELARWEERLAAARGCLLGESPASANTREALALRELSPDPWNRGTCTQLISTLSRGETEDTGLPAVEAAWRELERAAGKVGAAFLAHVDPMGEPAKDRTPDRLPVALAELDAAHAVLREAVDLPPPEARAAGSQLPPAVLVPLRDGDQPIRELSSWTMPTMGSVIAFGGTGTRELQMTLVPGASPVLQPVGSGVLRTVPDAAWGAGGGPDHVVIGALDDAGRLAPPGSPAESHAVKVEGRGRVFAVVGTAEDGVVIAGGERSLVVVRARAGKVAADKPIEIEQLAFALDPKGSALIAYNDADGKLRGFVAEGAAPARVVDLGETTAGGACLTRARGWIAGPDSDQIVSFDPEKGAVTPHTWEAHDLLGCTPAAALLQKRGASHFVVCAEECRVAVLRAMRPSKIATIAAGEVVSIDHRDQVLGVWREGGPPRFFSLPEPLASLELATSNGRVIDVIGKTAQGLVIVRVPAR
ncbi:MAG TPA: hypothetical protein VK932_15555, partial [Kofleriaceae bacterium]|nr:hypothetical protein [Kofleriaceae bacterium]